MTEAADEPTDKLRPNRCELSLWFGATAAHLPAIVHVVRDVCEFMAIDKSEGYEITLAVNEAVANSIEHAFRNDAEKQVGVRLSVDDTTFGCAIVEDGPVAAAGAVLKSSSLEEFSASDGEKGVGLTLMGVYMDRVERVRTEHGFEWQLARRLRGGEIAGSRDT